ncbi:MAG: hypothetical protein V7707_18770 [Motiliproteus sp.]
MSLDHTVEYTVEQAVALLTGKISLQALNSTSKPVQNYCANMFKSKDFWESDSVLRYYQQIEKGLRQGTLRAADYQVSVNSTCLDGQPGIRMIKQDQLSDEHELSVNTRISRSELRYWIASSREAHSFLMDRYELSVARGSWEAGKQAFLEAEGFGEEIALEPAENSLAGDSAIEIQALLAGTHEFQDEDLRIALQAWLTSVEQQRHPDAGTVHATPLSDGLEQEASSMLTLAATFNAGSTT